MTLAQGRDLLGVGELLMVDGWTGRIVAIRSSDDSRGLVVVVDTGDGRLVTISWADVVRRVLGRAQPSAGTAGDDETSALIEELPPEAQSNIRRLYGEVKLVQTGSFTGNPEADRAAGRLDPAFDPATTTQEQRIEALIASRRRRGARGASRATVYRQLKAAAGGIDGLVNGNRKPHRNLLAEHDPDVVDFVRQFVRLHKDEARISTKKLVVRVAAELAANDLDRGLSPGQLKHLVGEVSRGLGLDRKAASRRTHAKRPLQVHGRHEVSAPGEMVQIDGTRTTIHVWARGLGWQPVVILSAIDCYDREVVALRVCVGASNAQDVALLLADIERPMVTRAGWPYELENYHGIPRLACVTDHSQVDGPPVDNVIGEKAAVVPSTIVLDNGADMSASHLMASAERLGVTVVFCPPGTPHAKGVVEGFQNFLREIQSLLPGFKGEDATNHPIGVEEHALLTPQDLHDALWEGVLELYRWRPHRGLADALDSPEPVSPGQVFTTYLTQHGGKLEAPRDPYRAILAFASVECRLQDYGILVERRVYDSPELRELKSYYQDGLGRPRRKITVFYDRNVTDHVLTRHPFTGQWIRIPRRGSERSTERPWGELLTRHLLQPTGDGKGRTLTDPQLFEAEKQLAMRWRRGVFETRREQRIALFEESRELDAAHRYGELPEEVVRLAFGDRQEDDEPASYDDRSGLDADVADDDFLAYGEIEVEDLLL